MVYRYRPGDDHVYITNIVPDGAAFHDGRLQVGDKLIEVNGQDFTNVNHARAVAIFKSKPDGVSLLVERQSKVG